MLDASDVFDPKDFESIRLTVYFQNLTTRTEVRDRDKVSLVEIEDRYLVFEVPAKSCNEKHSVMARICRAAPSSPKTKGRAAKEKELLNVTGKVWEIEEVDSTVSRVTIECLQYDEKSWNDLLKLFSNRQNEIDQFLKAAKGY